jgi:hypothetical protein
MRKITLLIIGFGTVLLALQSCKKSYTNGYPGGKGLILGSYIYYDSIINENLDFSSPTATVSMTVSSKGDPVATVKIFVATGSNSADSSGWVLIKSVPYSDKVLLSVSTDELNTALGSVGSSVQAGTVYVLQNVVVTTDGRTFSATNTPSNYLSLAGYKMALTWGATAVCAFVQADAVGTYNVVSDPYWGDFAPGDAVTVAAGSNPNELLLYAYPNPAAHGINRVPIVIEVDPVSDIATVAKQVVGAYSNWPYGNLSVRGDASPNFVFSCTGSIQLTFEFTVDAGTFGDGTLTLQKQ